MEPISTSLIAIALGKKAFDIIEGACDDYLKGKINSLFGKLEEPDDQTKMARAYLNAMKQAFNLSIEMLLRNIMACGLTHEDLPEFCTAIEAFIKDIHVAEELSNAIRDPENKALPSPSVLKERWNANGGIELPSEAVWNTVAIAFRHQAMKHCLLSPDLRAVVNAQNIDEIKVLLGRIGGVKIPVERKQYFDRMRNKHAPVDLANLMPAYAEAPPQIVIRDVFVAQNVSANPSTSKLQFPKDFVEVPDISERDALHLDGFPTQVRVFEEITRTYSGNSSQPVLEIVTDPNNRLLVLTGEPGAGKSTLMRYLLIGIIEPPTVGDLGTPLSWTFAFRNTFPLLIELRDFHALRRRKECDTFLEYIAFMGKCDHWALDDHATNEILESSPSLILFDGLDEIFDSADRQRVQHEIAGFAQRYPHARIIVTSRPVGYKGDILRNAGFAHFGIQDLTSQQVATFLGGWFALTFPQDPARAQQRVERVLSSIRKSRSVRLLAGNPMLLTIMALLGREQELPRERAKFYEKAVEVLCHHWDANKNFELPDDAYLNVDDKKNLLRRIAMRMQAAENGLRGNVIQEGDLEHEVQAFLIDENWETHAAEAKKAARRMITQLRERNYILCLRGPRLYGFVHRTFLEYLTATEYVHQFHISKALSEAQMVELFERHCYDEGWQEVLRLICGQINEQFVGALVSRLTEVADIDGAKDDMGFPELSLATLCLSECRNIARLEVQSSQLLRKCIRALEMGMNFEDEPPSGFFSWWFYSLIPACHEVGGRWPRKDILFEYQEPSTQYIQGHLEEPWVELVVALEPSRDDLVRVVSMGREYIHLGALGHMMEKWPDQQCRELVRKLLEKPSPKARNPFVHHEILLSCTRHWPDEETKSLLKQYMVEEQNPFLCETMLAKLVDIWPDGDTRKFLVQRALESSTSVERRYSLGKLAQIWPDEVTRRFLRQRAVKGDGHFERIAALENLAKYWADEKTRKLLQQRAVKGSAHFERSAALEYLAKYWPSNETQSLVQKRVLVDGFAASSHGKTHSDFGRRVFTQDADGVGPFFDPTAPIPRANLEAAAKEAGVASEKINEMIVSLSVHMGWDITQGSARKVMGSGSGIADEMDANVD